MESDHPTRLSASVEHSSELLEVLANLTGGLVSVGPDWKVCYANRALEQFAGFDRSRLIGNSVWNLFPPNAEGEFEHEFRAAMRDRKTRTIEYYYARAGRWLEVRLCPTSRGGMLIHTQDISDQRRTQEALQDTRLWLSMAQEAAGVGFWEWDAVSESITASEGYYRLYGLQRGEPVPHHREWLSLVHPDDRPRLVKQISKVLAGDGILDAEFRIQAADGSCRWMLTKGKATFDREGRPLRMVGVNIDITSFKQARELERSNEELERFAYAASHDLRDPLRVIQSCARSIEGRVDEGGREMVKVIADSARRMIAITDGLLAYAMLGGADVLKREAVRMNSVFDWATLHLRPAIEEQKAKVSRGDLPEIDADASRMIQLMQNLVGNAIKHRSPDRSPEVRVEARLASGHWCFSVQDNGIGMKPGFEQTIFRLFGRLQDRRVAGAGIGLATCRKIVENHGGRIWAESVPGVGSTFFFTLPQ